MKKLILGSIFAIAGFSANAQTVETLHLVPQYPQSCGTLFSCTNIPNTENVINVGFSAAAGDPYGSAPTVYAHGLTCKATKFTTTYFPVSNAIAGRMYSFSSTCINSALNTPSTTVAHGDIKMYGRLVSKGRGVYTAVGADWSIQPGSTVTFEKP